MNTALYPLTAQQIRSTTLVELLGTDGVSYEALGAGVREALDCLEHSRRFYLLPEAVQPALDRFETQLLGALQALAEAKAAIEA